MEPDQLIAFFQRGLIPGPHESEEAFLKRAQSRQPLASSEWQEIAPFLVAKWGFSIDWVPIVYSSKKLFPWEGAVFWVQKEGQPLIQLRPSLQTKKLWGNSRPDILSHEAIHAARETFDEPRFEEFLAYTASTSSWKQRLGPLFCRSWEFPLFAAALFALPFVSWVSWVSIPIIFFFLGRLFYQHRRFHQLKKTLPLPILLCLTDQEIQTGNFFSNTTPRCRLIEALKKKFT